MTPGESTTTELYSRKTPWLPRVLSKQSGRRRSSGDSFRPFYNSLSGDLLGFKPGLRITEDKEVRFIANPCNDRELSVGELRKLAHDIVDDEYWIEVNNRLRVRFPYSFYLALSVQRIVWDKVTRWTEPDSNDGAYPNLWATDEGKAVMHRLIDDFIQSSADASTRPLLLFFPNGETLGNNDSPNYLDVISEVRVRYHGLDIVDLYSHEFDTFRLFVRPYDGHLSVYENLFVAATLVNYLHQSARSATSREIAERAQ